MARWNSGYGWTISQSDNAAIDFNENWRAKEHGSFEQFEKFYGYSRASVNTYSGDAGIDFSKITSIEAFCLDPMGNEFEIEDVKFVDVSSSNGDRHWYYVDIKPDERVTAYHTEGRNLEKMIFIFHTDNESYYYGVDFSITKHFNRIYSIFLNMYPKELPTHMYFSQNMDEAEIIFYLYSSIGTFEAINKKPAGSSLIVNVKASIQGKRSDNSELNIPGIFLEKTTNIGEWSSGYRKYPTVQFKGISALTSVPGDTIFSIVLDWNGKIQSSSKCIAHIEPTP